MLRVKHILSPNARKIVCSIGHYFWQMLYVTSEDLRLSDSRAPTAHNHELAEIDCGGITESYSPIIVGDSGSFSDVFDGGFF